MKQALQRRQSGSLPSNFTFRMMGQIRMEAVKQEKRKYRIMILFLIVALLVIIGSFVYCLFFYLGFKPMDLVPKLQFSSGSSLLFGFYTYIALLVLCLLRMDYWMRKKRTTIQEEAK